MRSVRKHVSTRDARAGQKTRAEKKKAASGSEAAKFREETPGRGGGFRGGIRNTALQQYAEMIGLVQVQK